MDHRNAVSFHAHHEPFWVIVEPWASEFLIRIGEECQLVVQNPEVLPTFGSDMSGDKLVLWVNESGSTFEFWRDGSLELSMPVPIPGWPIG